MVEVRWIDSTSFWGWQSPDDLARAIEKDDLHIRTCGYLLQDHPDYVVILQSYGEVSENAAGAIKIPRLAIVELTFLERSS